MEENNNPNDQNPTPIPTPPVSSNVQPPPPVSQPKADGPLAQKPKFPLAAIIGIVLFLLVAGGVAGFYAFKPQIMSLISKPTPTTTLTPSPTPDPASNAANATANWKTYTDSSRGYSMKYPPNFRTDEEGREVVFPYTSNLKRTDFTNVSSGAFIYGPAPDNANDPLSLDDFGVANFLGYLSSDSNVVENKQIALDGQPARMITVKHTDAYSIDVLFKYPTGTFGHNYSYISLVSEKQNFEIYKSEFDQILSTFKFTDQTQTIDTSNWKTFSGTSFSIKYPPTWGTDSNGLITKGRSSSQISTGDFSAGMGWITIDYPNGSLEDNEKSLSELTKSEPIILDGVSGVKLSGYQGVAGSVFTNIVLLDNKGQVISLSFTTQDLPAVPVSEFKQILSTFKFTN